MAERSIPPGDLAGQRFGRLTVLRHVPRPVEAKGRGRYLLCLCDCGTERIVYVRSLANGANSCGCLRGESARERFSRYRDLSGERFHAWMVLRLVGHVPTTSKTDRHVVRCWECRCVCGTIREVAENRLKAGNSTSCGCLERQRRSAAGTTHGKAKTPIHRCWQGMLNRCYRAKGAGFKNYGGRGITVCDRWRESFTNFYADMGDPPTPEHMIDRIDNDGNYEPGNCRWATRTQQNNNRRYCHRLTLGSETMTLTEWARHLGVPAARIRSRLGLGWNVEDALTLPSRHGA